nr:2-nonaprenyl-3-methyl-6-methoxy-1,4-benzoquinol hydroxylase [Ipomoea batatas]
MSSGSRAWIVAASMGAVEALKDQGFARWNYALRMIQQHAKSNLRPYSQATRLSSPSSALVSGKIREDKLKRAEESLRTTIMSSGSRAWIVAASMGAVEALKDQGFARWNYALRMIQQHAKSNLRPYSQATRLSSPSSALVSGKIREDKLKQAEESLRTTMYLSCWGPN